MGTPYTPPGTDPTGYPGPHPPKPVDSENEPIEPVKDDEEVE